jgi:prephenate dehydrogenase
MGINIAVIGLNRISTSAVMAITQHDKSLQVKGWDPDLGTRVAVDRSKVFQQITKKPKDAARGANLIFLGVDVSEKEPILKELAMTAPRDAVLVNLTPPYHYTNRLFHEILNDQFVTFSLYLAVRVKYFQVGSQETDSAKADLFEGCRIYIADSGNTEPAVLDLAVDLSVLLGGKPVIISLEELDGLVSAASVFQQLIAAEIMKTSAGRPGWNEGKFVAGVSQFQSTLALDGVLSSEGLAQTAVLNRENLLSLLDGHLRNLIDLREAISEKQAVKIEELVKLSINQRLEWLSDRGGNQASGQMVQTYPTVKEALKRIQNLGK